MIPSSSNQSRHETVNKVLVVPFWGLIEHEPLNGGGLIIKFKALVLVSKINENTTWNCHRLIWGFDKNRSFVDVKLLVLPPKIINKTIHQDDKNIYQKTKYFDKLFD